MAAGDMSDDDGALRLRGRRDEAFSLLALAKHPLQTAPSLKQPHLSKW